MEFFSDGVLLKVDRMRKSLLLLFFVFTFAEFSLCALQPKISVDNMKTHLDALQSIALNNGGNRAVHLPGYNSSAEYVSSILRANTNFNVYEQYFNFDMSIENSPPEFEQVYPNQITYKRTIDFDALSYTGAGEIIAHTFDAGNGCLASDFQEMIKGTIAVIARGVCSFSTKVDLATRSGAAGVVIYNYENQGLIAGTLGSMKFLPVFGTTYELGRSLVEENNPTIRMFSDVTASKIFTKNIIADTLTGRTDETIVIGSHLDSVDAGAGIDDNGSGSAANIELALQLFASNITLENRVRFAWWAGEELGLLGSEYYVAEALKSGDIKEISLNLNFDMLASPNYFRGVYDGSGAEENIRTQSIKIQKMFTDFFDAENLDWDLTEFDGRSDYGPFIANGVPAGGLFTGAEEVKPDSYRKSYGGMANTAFDPCYHAHCDDIYNVDLEVLEQNALAAFDVMTKLATTENLSQWLSQPISKQPRRKPRFRGPGHRFNSI